MVYAELSPAEGGADGYILRVANAGCIPPIIKRVDGSLAWVESGGLPLGIGLGAETGYQEHSLTLWPGDLIILTSDGLVEAVNADQEMFGFERFEQLIGQLSAGPAESALAQIQEAVAAFVQDTNPHDDMTIVVIRV